MWLKLIFRHIPSTHAEPHTAGPCPEQRYHEGTEEALGSEMLVRRQKGNTQAHKSKITSESHRFFEDKPKGDMMGAAGRGWAGPQKGQASLARDPSSKWAGTGPVMTAGLGAVPTPLPIWGAALMPRLQSHPGGAELRDVGGLHYRTARPRQVLACSPKILYPISQWFGKTWNRGLLGK